MIGHSRRWILTGYVGFALFNLVLNGHSLKEIIFSLVLGGLTLLDWIESHSEPPAMV